MKNLLLLFGLVFQNGLILGQMGFIFDGINYITTGTNTVEVTSGGNYQGNILIPSSVLYAGTDYKVTSIGKSAFSDKTNLSSVFIPNSIVTIGDYAFHDCSGLISVTIPSSVTKIGSWAFHDCSGLISVTIPSSVTKIGYSAFHNCSSLTSVNIPESVTLIESSTFWNCSSLTSITLPLSITSIEYGAFHACIGLTSVEIPLSVIEIGFGAFANCSGLTSINIPSSVISIDDYAFYNCKSLSEIIIHALTPPELGTDVFYLLDKSACILYVPKGCLDAYKSAPQWKDFLNIVESDVNSINNTKFLEVKFYPTLVSSYVNVEFEMTVNNVNLLVYNTMGKKVIEKELVEKSVKLDISLFPSGIYIIYTEENYGKLKNVGRFIKK